MIDDDDDDDAADDAADDDDDDDDGDGDDGSPPNPPLTQRGTRVQAKKLVIAHACGFRRTLGGVAVKRHASQAYRPFSLMTCWSSLSGTNGQGIAARAVWPVLTA